MDGTVFLASKPTILLMVSPWWIIAYSCVKWIIACSDGSKFLHNILTETSCEEYVIRCKVNNSVQTRGNLYTTRLLKRVMNHRRAMGAYTLEYQHCIKKHCIKKHIKKRIKKRLKKHIKKQIKKQIKKRVNKLLWRGQFAWQLANNQCTLTLLALLIYTISYDVHPGILNTLILC